MVNPFERPATAKHPLGIASLVHPQVSPDGRGLVVVLDKIEPGVEVAYCVHGRVSCYRCEDWCWLGNNTFTVVSTGEAIGLCRQCAAETIPPDTRPLRNLNDNPNGKRHE